MLEVITGCMYSGKTEELIRRLRRCQIAGQKVRAFKPSLDARYSETSLATHPIEGLGSFYDATPVRDVEELERWINKKNFDGEVIGFDEIQFMGPEVVGLLEKQANLGRRVIIAGLDLDSEGIPFGPIAELLARADSITKLTAVCTAHVNQNGSPCGKPATKSHRIPNASNGEKIQVGSHGIFEARCRDCWSAAKGFHNVL